MSYLLWLTVINAYCLSFKIIFASVVNYTLYCLDGILRNVKNNQNVYERINFLEKVYRLPFVKSDHTIIIMCLIIITILVEQKNSLKLMRVPTSVIFNLLDYLTTNKTKTR